MQHSVGAKAECDLEGDRVYTPSVGLDKDRRGKWMLAMGLSYWGGRQGCGASERAGGGETAAALADGCAGALQALTGVVSRRRAEGRRASKRRNAGRKTPSVWECAGQRRTENGGRTRIGGGGGDKVWLRCWEEEGGRESETPRWEKVFANKVGDGDAATVASVRATHTHTRSLRGWLAGWLASWLASWLAQALGLRADSAMRAGAHASRVELSRERGRSCAARQGRTGQGKAGRKEEKAAGSRQRELHQPRPAAEPHSGTSEEVRRRGEAAERVVTHGHLFLAKRRAKPRLPVLEAAAGTPNSSTSGPVPFRFGLALGQLRLVPACSKSCCPSAAPPPLPPFLHSALGPFLGSRIRLPSALCQSQSQTVIRARLLNPNPQPQTAQTTRFGSPAPTSSSVKLSDTVRSSISCRRLAMLVVVVVVRWMCVCV
ncbi:hypothetical protein L1887_53688 [Cichorium endivia]|nr:hypothetical protein L1887_53688 [Cichorium endivia]